MSLIYISLLYKLGGKISIYCGLFFLSVSAALLCINKNIKAEKFAELAYIYLVAGVLLLFLELKNIMTTKSEFNDFITILRGEPLVKIGLYYWKKLIKNIVLSIRKANDLLHLFFDYYYTLPPKTNVDKVLNSLKTFFLLIIATSIISILILALQLINEEITYRKKVAYRLSLNPKIAVVEPSLAYKSIYVIIRGDKFGFSETDKVRLKSNRDGDVTPVRWINDKMIIQIPASWNEGVRTLWIEKEIEWEGERIKAKSNKVQLEILPIHSKLNERDSEFFDLIQKTSAEVRKLNGYE